MKAEAEAGVLDSKYPSGPLFAYDNPLVMSLEAFVDHPLAHEMLHNGQTLQVRGDVASIESGGNAVGSGYLQLWMPLALAEEEQGSVSISQTISFGL